MNYALILSGGKGLRLGADIPKQYIKVGGKPIITYCLETVGNMTEVEKIVVVLEQSWRQFVEDSISDLAIKNKLLFADGGESRQESIFNGLKRIKEIAGEKDTVLVHDGARPLVSVDVIRRCFDGAKRFDGVMSGISVKDTIYFTEDGERITGTLDRSKLFAGQTPEAFNYGKYLKAHEEATIEEIASYRGSSEIAFVHGMNMGLVQGDERNFKITTSVDLDNFRNIIEGKE